MNPINRPGRHRAPGGFSPLGELKSLARESAQPAMKSAAVVAAAGGLVATFAHPAAAESLAAAPVAAPVAGEAAVVGPATASLPTTSALTAIGFATEAKAAPVARKAPRPVVIKDVAVEKKQAAEKVAAEKAAAERLATERASRDTTRRTLTSSTYSTKSTSNTRATYGTKSSHNWATSGQCTWGALNKWYQSEGYYPGGWTGNAESWGYGAASAGYTVSSIPRTRSIIVMQSGVYGSSSVGHVAWVTAVNGNEVTFIEMNALAGAYNYNTRTISDGTMSGIKYIYAP